MGPLDCLVRGRAARELETLEGASAVPDPDQTSWTADVARLCVDQRGLVARTEVLMTPVIVYSSWREGVDGPVDAYPAPVVDYNDRSR